MTFTMANALHCSSIHSQTRVHKNLAQQKRSRDFKETTDHPVLQSGKSTIPLAPTLGMNTHLSLGIHDTHPTYRPIVKALAVS